MRRPRDQDCIVEDINDMKRAISTSLLVLTLVSILSPTYGQYVGQTCTVDNSPGVCKFLQDCSKVYEEFVAETPSEICGFIHFEPIVCCPSTNVVNKPTPAPRPQTIVQTNTMESLKSNRPVGSVARAECAENAEALYTLYGGGFKFESSAPAKNSTPPNLEYCVATTPRKFTNPNKVWYAAVGGENAEDKEFPHMAAVGFDGPDNEILWNCGGSLISAKVVLTAAHCTWSSDWGNARWVRVGILNLEQANQNTEPQTIAIKERIKHPDYRGPSEYHDIAILRLEQKVTYNAWVRSACLPFNWPDVDQYNKVVATGWGLVDWADDKGPDHLMKVTLKLVPHESCNASYFDGGSSVELAFGIVDEWQICAGEKGKDTCQGDSGGPLSVFHTVHSCMYTVIGITSLGRHCGIIPGVYTRVHHYISWIEKTAWPEYF